MSKRNAILISGIIAVFLWLLGMLFLTYLRNDPNFTGNFLNILGYETKEQTRRFAFYVIFMINFAVCIGIFRFLNKKIQN